MNAVLLKPKEYLLSDTLLNLESSNFWKLKVWISII